MIALFWLFLALSVSPFKSKNGLAAENAALRYQLIVLQRRVRSRIQLTNGDRLFLVTLYRWFPRSSRPSRSSVPRLSYVGIEPASVGTGGGNPALLEADRRLLPVSVVGCYFWVDRPLALFAHDQTKQFDISITLTYIPEVLTAPVLVAFVVLGLRALNNQPLSRLQTTAVLAVASLAITELLKVQLKFIFGAFATLTINVPPSRLTATLDDGHALRASSIACWVSQDGR